VFVGPHTTVGAKDVRRIANVDEAREWLRTPYHHMARVKGAGADCLTLLAEVYEKAGVIPHIEVPFYPPDWNLHRDGERYLEALHAPASFLWRRQPSPQPAMLPSLNLTVFAHGAIVVSWRS
jgi:hypothetical protein